MALLEPHRLLTRCWIIQEMQRDTELHRGHTLQEATVPLWLGEQREEVRIMKT